ncbi:hypothetical protein AUJ40_01945 [Candidatus Berkelbacteria bacterium CG1_02_42_45]|uniref:Adenylate kinase n=1 Tax=Candidatus Berkelbacteria bacterium CG1_02_42_45 TaxID=1805036 RepID=A0A1J4RQU0_9BACT|nr:MAG: hypothetical protein AUJ40_01945 [Candidatus Berkelbacteria bacterium CG1_02_42_45]
MKRKVIVILGFPASGKGTQAEILAKRIEAKILGIGELVRAEMKKGDQNSARVKTIKELYDRGEPQKDEVVEELIENAVFKSSGDLIFDNYPFSENQIRFFESVIKKYNFEKPIIIYIDINPASSIKRISKRLVCDSCKKIFMTGNLGDKCDRCNGHLIQRPDDTAEIMRERVEHAKPRIDLVMKHFQNDGNVYRIDGEKTIPEVAKQIEKII